MSAISKGLKVINYGSKIGNLTSYISHLQPVRLILTGWSWLAGCSSPTTSQSRPSSQLQDHRLVAAAPSVPPNGWLG